MSKKRNKHSIRRDHQEAYCCLKSLLAVIFLSFLPGKNQGEGFTGGSSRKGVQVSIVSNSPIGSLAKGFFAESSCGFFLGRNFRKIAKIQLITSGVLRKVCVNFAQIC